MKTLNNYIINYETLLIIPYEDNKSKIFEVDEELIVNMKPFDIIKNSCLFFGSSYEGRREGTSSLLKCNIKLPIIIEDSKCLIFFPTYSFKNEKNIWVSYNNLVDYKKYNSGSTLFIFKNNNDIRVNVKQNIVDNQFIRCLKMEAIIRKRKSIK